VCLSCFCAATIANKDGKDDRYFSIVENHRMASNKTVPRTVLYLGESNDQQPAAWQKSLSVFEEERRDYENLILFPDREIPADAVDSLQVKMSGLELRRPCLYSRDRRTDCLQLVIALVITANGFPLAYEDLRLIFEVLILAAAWRAPPSSVVVALPRAGHACACELLPAAQALAP
jgi:hypothetical protein